MSNRQTQGVPAGTDADPRSQDGDVAELVRAQGQEWLESTRQVAATTLETLAGGVRDAASALERDGTAGNVPGYIMRMSDGMTRMASGLRERSGDDLIQEVGRIARENPALFMAGAIALGFGLTRFAKVSTGHGHGSSAKTGASPGSDPAASASHRGLARSAVDGGGRQESILSAGSLTDSNSSDAGDAALRGSSLGARAP